MNVNLQVGTCDWALDSWSTGLVAILPIHDEQALHAINHVWPLVSAIPSRAIGSFVLLYRCHPTASRLDWQFFTTEHPTFHLSLRP